MAAWLMALSLLLIIVFEAWWLRKTYRDEFASLRREAGLLLRETSVTRQMRFFFTDSSAQVIIRTDSVRPANITMVQSQSGGDTASTIIIRRQPDSGEVNVMRPRTHGTTGTRILSLEDPEARRLDTRQLKVTAPLPFGNTDLQGLDSAYKKALQQNDINLNYTLRQLTDKEVDSVQANFRFRGPSVNQRNGRGPVRLQVVEASFEHPRWMLLAGMMGQIGFALLLLSVTALAFLLLYRNLRQQQRLTEQKNELISNITHELKTPIATVSVAVEALKNFNALNDAEKTKEYLNISGNELQRLNLLVDKVLRLGMFENNSLELKPESVDALQVAEEVADSLKLQMEKAKADFRFETSGNNFILHADRMHLQSVMFNLLDNALKYSPAKPVIRMHLQEKENELVLQVQDHGIGIAPEYQHKIFEKFFRVPHGNTHNFKGYGLGLSYVNEVVKRMGGRIQVSSKPGEGSLFTIYFPKPDIA